MTAAEDQAGPSEEGPPEARPVFPCACCGAETRQDSVKAAFCGPQGWVVVEDVPARVCPGCGEQFYDDRTAQRIEAIVSGQAAAPARQIMVPVFSLGPDANNAPGLPPGRVPGPPAPKAGGPP
ncbi:MAG: YgiT-type zinc finger protein [Planctomycetes bacterium]|nr:YgiT-type zinc finger protein [Planctomycetota bacterium]